METTTTQAARTFACEVGFETVAGGREVFWIKSPRTGAKLTVRRDYWCGLPAGVIDRAAAAPFNATPGRAAFTAEELAGIKRQADREAELTRHLREALADHRSGLRPAYRPYGRFGRRGY